MLGLLTATDPLRVRAVEDDLETSRADHTRCELEAATVARRSGAATVHG